MAMIEDLLPPEVRQALADLAAERHLAATDAVVADLPEHVGERADGNRREQHDRHRARPPLKEHRPRNRPLEPRRRDLRAGVKVIVMRHARERARERFPGFKAARIVDEVHAALLAGRLSAAKPPGLIGGDFPFGLYAWTADGERIYGLIHGKDCFAVHTTMRRGVPA